MRISLIRVDDRLVHGQVLAGWARILGVQTIVVADDEAYGDTLTRSLMEAAAPPGMKIIVCTVDEISRIVHAADDRSCALVLVRDPAAALRLREILPYDRLNLGGVGLAPGRSPFFRNIYLSDQERGMLKALCDRGVEVKVQVVPSDAPVDFSQLNAKRSETC
ncbi:MAG: PTS sugar transporter subunit IIB [Bacillota bacterium]